MKRFVKIRSWHIVSVVRAAGGIQTLCGRFVPAPADIRDSFGDEKSCESCLRIEAAG